MVPTITNLAQRSDGSTDAVDRPRAAVTAPDHGRYGSKEEYWANWYEAEPSYEWNNGYLEAKPLPNPVQLQLFHWFLDILRQYLATTQSAELMGLETGFTMEVPDVQGLYPMKEVVRKPDLAVILHTNPVTWQAHERSYQGICDLCIEAISDSSKEEILRDTTIKKSEYEFAGVQEYYILDPNREHLHFYARNTAGLYTEILPDEQGVIRSEVLPGFQFRTSDLTWKRPLETLALDEVYRGYVLLRYQAAEARAEIAVQRAAQERQRAQLERRRAIQEQRRAEQQQRRAEQEQQRAEQEQRRAEQEQQRAEQYAAKLRALGIDPDA